MLYWLMGQPGKGGSDRGTWEIPTRWNEMEEVLFLLVARARQRRSTDCGGVPLNAPLPFPAK